MPRKRWTLIVLPLDLSSFLSDSFVDIHNLNRAANIHDGYYKHVKNTNLLIKVQNIWEGKLNII